LAGIQDQLGDLSWLGDAYADQGWVVVGEAPAEPAQSTASELAWEKAKQLLRDSDWSMLSDIPMTRSTKALWVDYRRTLREVRLQTGFPTNIQWPTKPE